MGKKQADSKKNATNLKPDDYSSEDSRYREIFEQTPVGILEEDYSLLKQKIDAMAYSNSEELRRHYKLHPNAIRNLIGTVKMTTANNAALRAYGTSSVDEFINDHMSFDKWWNAEWADFYLDEIVALYDQKLPFNREFTDKSLQGKNIHIRNVTRIVAGCENSWSRVITTIENITERKKIESELHQALKMEAIGQLTGGLAHDVNNILAIISGNAEILEHKVGVDNSNLQEIFHAIKSGSSLVRHLLSFSKKQPFETRVIDVNKVVHELVELLQRTLGESIEITIESKKEKCAVDTDQSHFENALLNLVLNARDAMDDEGKLVIKMFKENVKHSFVNNHHKVTPGLYVVVTVKDTGEGMTNEQMFKVFEPFYTTKDVGKGSGLGLSSVYGFVNQANGHVTIHSSVGVGTEVSLYLPVSSHIADQTDVEMPDDMAQACNETVLVLEDEAILRRIVQSMLEDLGYQVILASHGVEAIEILSTSVSVDLLLTDIGLPGGMNGVDVVEQARLMRPKMKCQFMSGYIKDIYQQYPDIETYGPVLNKPFRKSELAKRLRAVIEVS